MSLIDSMGTGTVSVPAAPRADGLRAAAGKLEAAFLAEMLKAARFGETPTAFGGGIGEDQFASLLRDAQAEEWVRAGGIGLAEQLFTSLSKGKVDGD